MKPKKCQHEGCLKVANEKGLCYSHGGYSICKTPDCIKKTKAGGHCIAVRTIAASKKISIKLTRFSCSMGAEKDVVLPTVHRVPFQDILTAVYMGVEKDVFLPAVHQVPLRDILIASPMAGAKHALNQLVQKVLRREASALDTGVAKNVHRKVSN